ncbi:M50 family metallopeptidase [Luedemannella flava]
MALSLVFVAWAVTGYASTIAHEGGHALTASAFGATVLELVINRDTSGHTRVLGAGPGASVAIGLAGYLGPSAFGLAGAALLSGDRARAVLWLSLFFLACALLVSRGWVSRVSVLALGGAFVLVLRAHSPNLEAWFAYTWIWFLLISGVRDTLGLARIRSRGPDRATDAYHLRQLTYVPASVFTGLFVVLSLAAAIFGAVVLLGGHRGA